MSTFMLLASLNQSLGLCAAAAGIAGHMSARLLFVVERAAERKINSLFNTTGESDESRKT